MHGGISRQAGCSRVLAFSFVFRKGERKLMPRITKTLFSVLLLALLIPGVALAAQKGDPTVSSAAVSWPSAPQFQSMTLVVMAPSGAYFTKEFTGAQSPTFVLKDLGANLAVDGVYAWEMHFTPRVPAGVQHAVAQARERGDDAAAAAILKNAGVTAGATQSGVFGVSNGAFIIPSLEAQASQSVAQGSTNSATNGFRASSDAKLHAGTNDVVTADDEIIQGSLCVGLDCVNNESFGFDTIRLKENNDRIKFDDTSTSAGFPNHDWQLTANDSASGGANKFSIEDITTSTVPFTVTGGASTNSIFVDSTGRVGFRTSTPVLDLHISTSNTPAIRQEQTNAAGFTAQTWDIGANEANWFVRDVTGGSRLPLRIRPGAPTSSVDIAASGNVGIGTASPGNQLHILGTGDVNTIAQVQNANVSTGAAAAFRTNSDTAQLTMFSHSSARTTVRFGQAIGGWNEINAGTGNGLMIGTSDTHPLILGTVNTARLTIAADGSITVPGNFTVSGTKNFAVVDPTDSHKALYYTALEGPEAGTYYRGSAKTVNGEVTIELPDYFANLTENERMTVQLTPVGAPGQLYVASKTPQKIVIKVAKDTADMQFDYLVQGVRKGYLNYEVVRPGAFPAQK